MPHYCHLSLTLAHSWLLVKIMFKSVFLFQFCWMTLGLIIKCLSHKLCLIPWLADNLLNQLKLVYVSHLVSYLSSIPACFFLCVFAASPQVPLPASLHLSPMTLSHLFSYFYSLDISQNPLSSHQCPISYFLPQLIDLQLSYWQVMLIRDPFITTL